MSDSTPTDPTTTRPPTPTADDQLHALSSLIRHLDSGPAAPAGSDQQPRVEQSPAPQPPPGPAQHPAAVAPRRAEPRQRAGHENKLIQVRLGIASSLFATLRAKHVPTASHSLRVALSCSSWSFAMELSDGQRDEIEIASLLHDMGKIGVPDRVLQKPGKLTREEIAIIERHRQVGLEILRSCCASQNILDTIQFSPAWFDGSRGDFGRSERDLPLGSRMIAIVDAFDAMTSDQIYRRALSRERAMSELFEFAGTQFDPELVKHFCSLDGLDQVKLHAGVARFWLNELDPQAANGHWRRGEPVTTSTTVAAADLFNEKLFDNMHDGVVFVDTGLQITRWNRAAERLTGITQSSVDGKQWSPELVDMWDEKEENVTMEDCPVALAIRSGVQSLRRMTIQGRNDRRVAVDAHAMPVVGCDGTTFGATLVLHDASSETTLEQHVQKLYVKATRDPLTQVANRAEFDRLHNEFIREHLKRSIPCSLIICDIDHFKQVNDTFGHQAGDEVLVSFSAFLQRSCRLGDLVARYGGEEFVMLCADCDNATATNKAEQMRSELAGIPHQALNGKCITASFGVTEVQTGDTPKTMLRRADRGVYQAKELGRNTVVQLGSGLSDKEETAESGWWARWFQNSQADTLLERELVTTVPINVATEKLRGFVADHNAEIVSVDENHIVISFAGDSGSLMRRSEDRSVPFLVDLTIEERKSTSEATARRGSGCVLRTTINVSIRPKRSRDRRRRGSIERARQLLCSLKSYLMAQEVGEAEPLEGAGGDDPSED